MAEAPIPLLGRIALHLKMITVEQLSQATRQQGRAGGEKNLGAILIELGFITETDLQKILKARQQVVAKHRAKAAVEATAPADGRAAVEATAPADGRAAVEATAPADGRAAVEATAPAAGAAPAQPAAAPEPATPAAANDGDSLFGGDEDVAPAAPAAAPAEQSPAPAPAKPIVTESPDALIALLRKGVEQGASDIHIHAGIEQKLRLHGRFQSGGGDPIPPEQAEKLIRSALDPEQQRLFDELGELDFAWSVPGLGRFRVNVFQQQRGCDGVFRHVPEKPVSLEELGLPTALAKFTNYHQGLVLVTGPANCGKSSTLAAMVDLINEERREHILTVEDPIETLHPSKRCVVNQRNVGPHTESFARALRGALREDPDVIVIGELRDLETISLALTAAETGHLVLGTLHTNSTIRTINRLVGVFPADQQEQIRSMVSESLRAVVSQRLVPTADGNGRVPALEILVNNKAIGNLIRENKTFQIFSILQTGASQGMCLLDESLNQLVAAGTITRDAALEHCDDAKRIK